GCGGLGSNCAMSLARTGIGKLVLADFDVVDESNLNRQYYFLSQTGKKKIEALKENILSVNPSVEIETHEVRIQSGNAEEIFRNSDVVVEAFDKAEDKAMLVGIILEKFPNKYIVSASGLAGYGSNNSIKTAAYGNLFLCGDGKTEVSDDNPPLAPKVPIVANMQANQVVELLMKI
ncbi:sulfur carrier protein ThiS adenylyltransferase ThiF, partial [candidate division WOR-3 bacterium]|nr:sulfur carrier protein ThiS adenylyltransferase ThiF [candidate division WOR-3 bacterium]